ncbi:hypothetical protein C0J29_32520 (plasmid) [Mycobacterium paragordonae]|uniref:Uncharacterized protein n=1 Tax=Mycobacterium paragordonae TaxID=1389713 RepID=A0ABQ1CG47_9MYCO|nr:MULTISPECIES: hypothetical protein [Mycobacterium]AYE99688.1 hypothetical protein C0J29_32520 [Mycobacterium paragordonae]BDE17457.1 hypothetical protein MKCMC460_63170 [Mycobacterium sp. 20KCMC460]GFG83312.1 hypothetical protein MPRG_65880 [Mycobacterium paragordonae]
MDAKNELCDILRARGTAFVFRPLVTHHEGVWRARYPGAEWSVSGNTRDEAASRLRDRALSGLTAGENRRWEDAAIQAAIEHGPLPGVYEIPMSEHEAIMASADPQAALDAALAVIDAQRERRQ